MYRKEENDDNNTLISCIMAHRKYHLCGSLSHAAELNRDIVEHDCSTQRSALAFYRKKCHLLHVAGKYTARVVFLHVNK